MFQIIWGRIFFTEADPVIRKGRHSVLQPDDFAPLPASLDPRAQVLPEERLDLSKPSAFLFSLVRESRPYFIPLALFNWSAIFFMLLNPLLVNWLVKAVSQGIADRQSLLWACALATGMGLCSLFAGVLMQQYFYQALVIQQIFNNLLNRKIYTHSLFLTPRARLQSPTGDVVNHMSSDTDTIADLPLILGDICVSVMTVLGATAMLFWLFGSTAFVSIGLLAVTIPLTKGIATRFTHLEEQLMAYRDQRITLMTQVLNGIRIIKYFAWEKSVAREVDILRQRELQSRWRLARAESLSMVGYVGISLFVLFVTFTVHVWRNGEWSAATMFTAVALFQLMAEPFGQLSQHVSRMVYALVGADRILRFLHREQLPKPEEPNSEEAPAIRLQNVCVELSGKNILQDITLEIPAGKSIAIVGAVGAGKSTLLQVLLGEEKPEQGFLEMRDSLGRLIVPRFAYVPQEAYITNDSLRENILFGQKDVTELKLRRAIEGACLEKDIAELPAGLETEIGERGVNLSGGQKQRVSLARAALYEPTLVLLDDPLSAVDPRTEALLARKLLFGAWKQATRLVVTHRLAHLRRFDLVVFLQNGRIEATGKYEEVLAKCPAFARFAASHVDAPAEAPIEESAPMGRPAGVAGTEAELEASRRLTDAEERQIGSVKSSVYWQYFWALGGKLRPRSNLALLVAGISAVVMVPLLQRLWLAKVADFQQHNLDSVKSYFWDALKANPFHSILVYGLLSCVVVVAMLFNDILWIRRGLVAGKNLHDGMLQAILSARVRFFDATPIGRILQRFSRDTESVDVFLQNGYKQTALVFAEITISLLLIVSVLPAMLLFMAPLAFLYYRLQKDYRGPARESKRLDSISRSPRFAHFKETLQGLSVIRSYRRTDIFLENFYRYFSHSQRMFRGMYMVNRWFSCRIPLLGAVIAALTSVGLILSAYAGQVSTGIVGVILVYLLGFWQLLNRGIRWFSELEARMTSVERIRFYSRVEAEEKTPAPNLLPAWPKAGAVEFQQAGLRYAKHLPQVLREVSFSAPAGARVGIVGRTGSGKSTLIQALYRCVELSHGRILVDGVDIAEVPLEQLRKALAIIPQDPILFLGSLRSNLDRYSEYSDDEIWFSLERANLAALVRALPNGLDTNVVENGLNFSLGQRQLLCLARALLARVKIIVLDEATASVDVETDELVQKVIRQSCVGVTMLIIAHRLSTVEDADLIVELERGKVTALRQSAPPGLHSEA